MPARAPHVTEKGYITLSDYQKLNVDAFLAQARAYDDLSTTQLGDMLKQAQTAQFSHPVPV
jgi:hypothetical protein